MNCLLTKKQVIQISISKKNSHIVEDNGKYYFILPGGLQDREIDPDLVEKINWAAAYRFLYRYKLEHNINEFEGSLADIFKLIKVYIQLCYVISQGKAAIS